MKHGIFYDTLEQLTATMRLFVSYWLMFNGSEYNNYKNSFWTILIAVVDTNYCFHYIAIEDDILMVKFLTAVLNCKFLKIMC